jgi:hypothetical protein
MSEEKAATGIAVLAFSVLTGICISASYLALFNQQVPFSIFPIVCLGLSVYCLYQRYVNDILPEGIGPVVVGSCLLGLFGYITVILVEYTSMGSNMIPTLVCLILLFWTLFKYSRVRFL